MTKKSNKQTATRKSSRPAGAEQRLNELGIALPVPPEPVPGWSHNPHDCITMPAPRPE
jgi:hypothetical protein